MPQVHQPDRAHVLAAQVELNGKAEALLLELVNGGYLYFFSERLAGGGSNGDSLDAQGAAAGQ
jgi:hypothetical protein